MTKPERACFTLPAIHLLHATKAAEIQATPFPEEPLSKAALSKMTELGRPSVSTSGGTATIHVEGIITKTPNIYTYFFGGTAATMLREEIDAAVADPNVDTIRLVFNSPGGFMDGVGELANHIRSLRDSNAIQIMSHVDSLAASAAYWLAAQGHSVTATEFSEVGSIGVFTAVDDVSAMFEREGITRHLVGSGGVKGGTVMGVKISDEVIADLQRTIDNANDLFVSAVSAGRGMSTSRVRAVNTGQVWYGAEALSLGLVDELVGASMIQESRRDKDEEDDEEDSMRLESQGQSSNTTPTMNSTSQVSSMTESTNPESAATAPPAAGGTDTDRILAAIQAQSETVSALAKEVEDLKAANEAKEAKVLQAAKDEAIALGLDADIVDECASTAEVARLVKASNLSPKSPSTRGAPSDKKTEEENEPIFSVAKAYKESGGNPRVIRAHKGVV